MLEMIWRHAEQTAMETGKWIIEQRGCFDLQFKKNHSDLVTNIDRESERQIIQSIKEKFPDDLILSEESAGKIVDYTDMEDDSHFCWVIDPLDGTMNFVHDIPHFAVSIAVVKSGKPLIGVVYEPIRGELFSAMEGQGAYLNGKRIMVSERMSLIDSLLYTGYSAQDWNAESVLRYEYSKAFGRCRNVRISGSAALDLAFVAAGRIDGFWQRGLAPWDIAAGILLVKEAGGRITGLATELYALEIGDLMASNGYIHMEMMNLLNEMGEVKNINS